jgi:hypothetical protein
MQRKPEFFSELLISLFRLDFSEKEMSPLEVEITHSIARIESLLKNEQDDALDCENPVFILSAGWRSGSTLLQRMIMADEKVLIWGEPYAHSSIVQSLCGQIQAISDKWPNVNHLHHKSGDISPDTWIANLSPPLLCLRKAHRMYFDNLFGEPARNSGRKIWGLKEVRLNTRHAVYLKWLFPHARFLFLARNPFDAWLSYKQRGPWYYCRPQKAVSNIWEFSQIWNDVALDFWLNHHETGGLLLKYEELNARHMQIGNFLGTHITAPRDMPVVRGNAVIKRLPELRRSERIIMKMKTGKSRSLYGYE